MFLVVKLIVFTNLYSEICPRPHYGMLSWPLPDTVSDMCWTLNKYSVGESGRLTWSDSCIICEEDSRGEKNTSCFFSLWSFPPKSTSRATKCLLFSLSPSSLKKSSVCLTFLRLSRSHCQNVLLNHDVKSLCCL